MSSCWISSLSLARLTPTSLPAATSPCDGVLFTPACCKRKGLGFFSRRAFRLFLPRRASQAMHHITAVALKDFYSPPHRRILFPTFCIIEGFYPPSSPIGFETGSLRRPTSDGEWNSRRQRDVGPHVGSPNVMPELPRPNCHARNARHERRWQDLYPGPMHDSRCKYRGCHERGIW